MEINIQRIREGKVTSIEKIVMIHWKYNIAARRRYFKRQTIIIFCPIFLFSFSD